MSKSARIFFFLPLLMALLFAPGRTAAEESMPATNLHRLIASHPQGWLNTARPLTAEDLQGRIILLDFWTYCCINCMHVIPDLKYLEEKFGPELTVIGVHSAKFKNERDSENIRSAILRYGIHHPVVNDFDFSVWQGFGVRAWPTFVLINPKGTIEEIYSGEGNREAVARDIERLQSKYAGKINTAPLPLALEADKQPPTVLSFPGKLAYAPDFKGRPALFVSDSGHQRIVAMTPDGSIIDSIGSGSIGRSDGAFDAASFHTPQGLAYNHGILYIADTDNHLLRAADFATRQVTTLAGTGKQGYERSAQNKPALETPLASPWDVAFYPDERHLAIAMAGTHQLWSYDLDKKTVSVIAGNGRESIDDGRYPYNSLSQPSGLSAATGKLYFVDSETSSLRVFDGGEVKTLIGTGLFDFGYAEGRRGVALMQHPLGLYADTAAVYIADSYNHSIRRFDPATGMLSNFAGHGARGSKDGALAEAEFNEPNDVLKIGNTLYIADTNNNAIRLINLDSKQVSALPVTQPFAAEFSDNLPGLQPLPAMRVAADAPLAVTFPLAPGWHINKDAPSFLALFDADKKPLASFDTGSLKEGHATLPALKAGAYTLQATLYYCQDKEGAQCLLKSFSLMLHAKAGGHAEIVLPLQ
ncbi:MAG: redoxin domain-containing protein [Pseudomonadota bacterium]|nr:redoxin domain-containing protein [Pseudomonadota bacterium]